MAAEKKSVEALWLTGGKTEIVPSWRPAVGSVCSEKRLPQTTSALFALWTVSKDDRLDPSAGSSSCWLCDVRQDVFKFSHNRFHQLLKWAYLICLIGLL